MNEASHTAGPWTFEYDNSDSSGGGCWYSIKAPDGRDLLWFPYNGPESGGERERANAQLISAAPLMLNELLAIERLLVAISDTDYPVSDELESVRATIAKATTP